MYAELICRTHYSFLRGASHPSEVVQRAAELGLAALAITDRDGVYGVPKAYRASQSCPQLKLIVGAELTLENPLGIHSEAMPLHLLAKDRSGYGLLCRLLTASHEGQEKGKALLSWKRFVEMMKEPSSSGLIALIHSAIQLPYAALSDLFQGRLYLALYRVLDGEDRARTEQVLQLSRKFQIPIIATNDVHFHVRPRRVLQDVLTAIRENTSLDQIGRRIFSNSERYLKSYPEMKALFADIPEALSNTLVVAEQCNFSPSELRYYYPSEWIPAGETAQGYLERLTWLGAKGRYPEGIPEDVTRQLRHELNLIELVRFADYFLTIWEIVEFARMQKILCQGRGSAANSAVCFCLGITAIDPVRMNLLFERFISVERGEPPDIDVDFEHERREEVIQHIYDKYGRDRAGMVSAIVTYRTRSAIRDVKKVLGEEIYGKNEGNSLALVNELKGFPRHLSIHSGGFTLSACPIIETVPIEPARMEGRTIVQWDKEDLDYIGLLKVDILALGMLTAIRKTFDSISMCSPSPGTSVLPSPVLPLVPRLEIATIPPDDEKTYQMIRRAETVGVFQIESRAQMNMLRRLLPENFYDLVIQVAIVRPGPIQGKMVHPYLKRRRKLEDSKSPDPRMEPILARTLGVPLFQEQVMKIAMVMADFTPGEADELRRAIGAWRSSGSIEKMGNRLKQGLLANGLAPEFVERIFQQIQGFAEYGFPESHAASFALLAYASSYLKCHYPTEFTCALLNSQPMGFYSSYTLVEDAKRQGVTVLPLDPRFSVWDCTLEQGALRIGWRMVQGLGRGEVEEVLKERASREFSGLRDFLSRVRLSLRILNRLAMGDAFACYGLSQREALWEILHLQVCRPAPVREQQLNLFQYTQGVHGVSRDLFTPLSQYQAIQSDYESYHLSVKGHPMLGLRADPELRKKLPPATSILLKKMRAGQMTRTAGLVIVRQRPPTAKGTMFATLEDEWGFADLILHAQTFEKYQSCLESSPFVLVAGKIQRDGDLVNLLVSFVGPLFPVLEPVGI